MSLVDLGKKLLECARQGETEEVRQLMTNGAPFTTDWLGTSPLHLAAQYGHIKTAEVLLRAGISRDAKTKVDRTPLHVAAQEGHSDIVELLLKHGADLEAKDMLKMTALHWGVERGHLEVIQRLLKYGANVCSTSKFYKTPIDIALDNCRQDLVDLLNEHVGNVLSAPLVEGALEVKPNLPSPISTMPSEAPVIIRTQKTKNAHFNPKNTSRKLPGSIPPLSIESLKRGASSAVGENEADTNATSVLATLAALAEATSPGATLTNAETLQWLETHGITMLPADSSSIVTSAVESGQTISLTDAGKLALNWMKEHSGNGTMSKVTEQPQSKRITYSTLSKTRMPQKVITIVENQPLTSVQDNPGVVLPNSDNPSKESNQPSCEKGQSEDMAENEREKLLNELEEMKRQAELYKAQLQLKENEAQRYKRQLEQMQMNSCKEES